MFIGFKLSATGKKNVRVRFVLSADGLNVRWKKSVVVISELNGKKGGLKKSDAQNVI